MWHASVLTQAMAQGRMVGMGRRGLGSVVSEMLCSVLQKQRTEPRVEDDSAVPPGSGSVEGKGEA